MALQNIPRKRETNNNFASLPRFPDLVFKILQNAKPSEEKQQDHGWNPSDRSPNIRVETDHRSIMRMPVADSTDSVRGKKGYSTGIHIWEVFWPTSHRGSHSVIGVATKDAELHAKHYCSLVGSNQYSWGWNIVGNQLHHNTGFMSPQTRNRTQLNSSLVTYPYKTHNDGEFKVPETFLMILDMDEGTLAFSVDGVYLGVAFHRLKGQNLYPIISAVWGNAKIQLNYQGGIGK